MSSTGVTHTGQPGPVHQLEPLGQQIVDAVAHDGVRLAAADLHEHPAPGDHAAQLGEDCLGAPPVAEFVDVLHRAASSSSAREELAQLVEELAAFARRLSLVDDADGEADVHHHPRADRGLRDVGQAHLAAHAVEVDAPHRAGRLR